MMAQTDLTPPRVSVTEVADGPAVALVPEQFPLCSGAAGAAGPAALPHAPGENLQPNAHRVSTDAAVMSK